MSLSEKTYKNILLGVAGGIAAYKTASLIRLFKQANHRVKVVMTPNSKQFITPLTMQTLSQNPIVEDLFNLDPTTSSMEHITLAKWADFMLIAPASANCIAKLAHGLADDLLSTLALATQAPIYLAPAMNQVMWNAKATQANINLLKSHNINILGPNSGNQACGDVGLGRMLEPEAIFQELPLQSPANNKNKPFNNIRILITAGPTQEPIDPVRYLSNRSSGEMGYTLANAALQAGAQVTLISGPVNLKPPINTQYIQVKTAHEMLAALKNVANDHDIFISTAAVADYRVQDVSKHKIKKTEELLNLSLEKNPDILSIAAQLNIFKYLVGFAAETEDLEQHAREKLIAKNIDMICANLVGKNDSGFNSPYNELLVLTKNKEKKHFPKQDKYTLATKIINYLARNYYAKYPIKNSQ